MFKLETNRLILREMTEYDYVPLYEIFSDRQTMNFYPKPFSKEKTKAWISCNQERYLTDGHGLWSVVLKETGVCIGDCGLVKQQFLTKSEIEVGYHINKKYWNKGYATEAAKACIEYGFNDCGLDKLISIIKAENLQSIRVAEKNGFTKEREDYIFGNYYEIYSKSNR